MTRSHPHLPLPLELRQQIYTDLFTGPYLVFGPPCATPKTTWTLPIDRSPLPILLVSKQMTLEATPILYKTAFFLFRLLLSTTSEEPTFTAPHPRSLARMQNVVFEISYEEEGRREVRTSNWDINIERSLGMLKGTSVLRNCLRITFAEISEIIWIMDRWTRKMSGFRELRFEIPLTEWRDMYDVEDGVGPITWDAEESEHGPRSWRRMAVGRRSWCSSQGEIVRGYWKRRRRG